MIFPRINLPNFVQFKQYKGKSGPRRTTRYFVQSKIFAVFTTVNISSLNTNTVTKWWKTENF